MCRVANNVSRMNSSSLQSTRVSWPSIWQNSGRTRLAANLFSITCHLRDIVGKMQASSGDIFACKKKFQAN